MSSRPVGENVFIGPFNKLQYIRDDLVKSVCYGEWQKHRILKPFTSKIWNLILLTSHHISLCWPFRTIWQSEISLILRRRWKLIGSLSWESIELQKNACFSNPLSCELKKRVMFNTTPFECIFLHELLKAVLFFCSTVFLFDKSGWWRWQKNCMVTRKLDVIWWSEAFLPFQFSIFNFLAYKNFKIDQKMTAHNFFFLSPPSFLKVLVVS